MLPENDSEFWKTEAAILWGDREKAFEEIKRLKEVINNLVQHAEETESARCKLHVDNIELTADNNELKKELEARPIIEYNAKQVEWEYGKGYTLFIKVGSFEFRPIPITNFYKALDALVEFLCAVNKC